MDIGGTNVADCRYIDVVWIQRTDQNVSFVACSNHANANRVVGLLVVVVHRAQPGSCHPARSDRLAEKFATVVFRIVSGYRTVVVVATVFDLFWSEINHGYAPASVCWSDLEGCEKKKSNPP